MDKESQMNNPWYESATEGVQPDAKKDQNLQKSS